MCFTEVNGTTSELRSISELRPAEYHILPKWWCYTQIKPPKWDHTLISPVGILLLKFHCIHAPYVCYYHLCILSLASLGILALLKFDWLIYDMTGVWVLQEEDRGPISTDLWEAGSLPKHQRTTWSVLWRTGVNPWLADRMFWKRYARYFVWILSLSLSQSCRMTHLHSWSVTSCFQIEDYICGPGNDLPLVLVASAGEGKSSIMAKIADVSTTRAVEEMVPG